MDQDTELDLEARVEMLEETVATLAAMLVQELGFSNAQHIAQAMGCEIEFDNSDNAIVE